MALGAQGVAARSAGRTWHWPARAVAVVDTTGAGDTFACVYAAARRDGRKLLDALSRAMLAAALACTRPGEQPAQPLRCEIEEQLARCVSR